MSFPLSLVISMMVITGLTVVDGGGSPDSLPECANSPILRQPEDMQPEDMRHQLQCPHRAVCGDEWRTVRDWYNGTACNERRVVVNCQCPDNRQCPIGDEQHVLYANTKHRQYLCEPKCSLGRCSTRLRAAEEMVQDSPEFDHNNFYRINCRCPGHTWPLTARPGSLNRSTSYSRLRFNFTAGIVYTQYSCSAGLPLDGEDPCENQLLQL